MRSKVVATAALAVGMSLSSGVATSMAIGPESSYFPAWQEREANATSSFDGSCDLKGKINPNAASDDKQVMRGTCTGKLNGAPARSYPVRVVTRTSGVEAGAVPLVLNGMGKTRFIGQRITFRWSISQTATVFTIRSVEGGRGWGYIVPKLDGTFDAHAELNGMKS